MSQERWVFPNESTIYYTGHVAAVLELADQIDKGEAIEPDNIFLPIGSTCTVSGMIVGTIHIINKIFTIVGLAIARKFGSGFKKPLSDFSLHGIHIHHKFAKVPFLVKLQVSMLVRDTARTIKNLGGPDVTEDVKEVRK